MAKAQNTIIKFEKNVPVHLTLETDPSQAKRNERQADWGKSVNFTYFINESRVMFASETLHNKLQEFDKGDSLVITLSNNGERNFWVINPAGNAQRSSTDVNPIIQQLIDDVEMIKKRLDVGESDPREKEDVSKDFPKDESKLNF